MNLTKIDLQNTLLMDWPKDLASMQAFEMRPKPNEGIVDINFLRVKFILEHDETRLQWPMFNSSIRFLFGSTIQLLHPIWRFIDFFLLSILKCSILFMYCIIIATDRCRVTIKQSKYAPPPEWPTNHNNFRAIKQSKLKN